MTIYLEFDGELPTLNQYIHKSNQSRWAAATLKRDYTEECSLVFQAQARGRKISKHCTVVVKIYGNRRTDDYNEFHKLKYIMDGLVEAGIIPDDSKRYVHILPECLLSERKQGRKRVEYVTIDLIEDEGGA